MKKLFVLLGLFLVQSLAFAGKYQNVKIILQNGKELEGLATLPENPSPVPILFKEDKDAKPQSINCDNIKTLVYTIGNDKISKTIEFDRVSVYLNKSDKMPQKVWLQVSTRGEVTLYTYDGIDIYTGVNSTTTVFQKYWLCCRAGEEVATFIASTASKNKKDAFVSAALEYFKDAPELTEKIKSNQYQWSDMDQIVDEYNERKKK